MENSKDNYFTQVMGDWDFYDDASDSDYVPETTPESSDTDMSDEEHYDEPEVIVVYPEHKDESE
jgi:hypothetical protein